MKKMLTVLFAAVSLALFVNCGTTDGDDNGNHHGSSGDNGNNSGNNNTTTPADNIAPFRSIETGVLEFSTAYISGASCAQVRGNLPGITWNSGLDLGSEHDGYRAVSVDLPAGTYEMSYLGWANCSSRSTDIWADYGLKEHLTAMSATARGFVSCNWWNGSSTLTVSSPSCKLLIQVKSDGTIVGSGNMQNYNGQ